MGAFTRKLVGAFSPFAAEGLAIREGLRFAKESRLKVDVIESDSSNAVDSSLLAAESHNIQ